MTKIPIAEGSVFIDCHPNERRVPMHATNIARLETCARRLNLTLVLLASTWGMTSGTVASAAPSGSPQQDAAQTSRGEVLEVGYDSIGPSTIEVVGVAGGEHRSVDASSFASGLSRTVPVTDSHSPAPRSAADFFSRPPPGLISPIPTERSRYGTASRPIAVAQAPPAGQDAVETLPDPCQAAKSKRATELTIDIAMTPGDFPHDYAAACSQQIDSRRGTRVDKRDWATFDYHWSATAFCHRPLYFEEVNLERYGYGCAGCLQPAVSGAHFFGTVAALPYCMTVQCPSHCIYTLGHYRPGSCPPWQRNWPPCIGTK